MLPHDKALLRPLAPDDLAWVVTRHGVLYKQAYGWDHRFEALVASIGNDFIYRYYAAHDAAWIAEREGQPVGCVFVVQARDDATGAPVPGVAQLRLLLVEPAARGHGLGRQLTQACEDFAANAGYTRMRLWTNSLLLAARHIYAQGGYHLLASEPHHSFGHDLVGEVWEKTLRP